MLHLFRARPLSRLRICLAMFVAVAADGIQIALGPLGWTFFDEAIDVFTMLVTSLLIGFHPLLLPTFLVEVIPLVDMLPTWTGCVAAVVLLRRRLQQAPPVMRTISPTPPPTKPGASSPIIDV
jgi:hypothetical protein